MEIHNLITFLKKNDLQNFKRELRRFSSDSLSQLTFGNEDVLIELEYNIMQHAVINGRYNFVTALLETNVNPNIGIGDENPLLLAARYGHYNILECFIKPTHKIEEKCPIRLDECNSNGENVLHLGKFCYNVYMNRDIKILI